MEEDLRGIVARVMNQNRGEDRSMAPILLREFHEALIGVLSLLNSHSYREATTQLRRVTSATHP